MLGSYGRRFSCRPLPTIGKRHPCQPPPMTNPLSKAGKRFFAHDPDVRRYAAADTAYDDNDYVPEHTEDERADADRRKVRLILFSSHSNASSPSRPFIPLPPSSPFTHTQCDIPPGLSERDAAILCCVKRRASVLDNHFRFCGARFGLTFVVG